LSKPGWQRALRLVGLGLAALLGLVSLGIGIYVWPWFRDDRVLDDVVRVVALDWRDFGRTKGLARLQYEFDAQAIGSDVRDQDCDLELRVDGTRLVYCAWEVALEIPQRPEPMVLHFESAAAIDPEGRLYRP